ncbi:TRAP transporter small permease subunit [Microbacterium sp. NPDC055357]
MTTTSVEEFAWLRWIDRLSTGLGVVGGVASMLLMVNVVADVVGRMFFRPLPGTIDLVQFAWMPTIASLGLGYALLKGQHIRVGLLTSGGSPRLQRIVEIVGMTLTLGTVAALAWFGMERAITSAGLLEHPITSPWLPTWLFRWVLVVGLIGLTLQVIAQLVRAATVPEFHPDDEDEVLAYIEEQDEDIVPTGLRSDVAEASTSGGRV